MDDLPADLLAEIEADVQRYRATRINAAKKRLAKNLNRKKRSKEQSIALGLEVFSARYYRGESWAEIAAANSISIPYARDIASWYAPEQHDSHYWEWWDRQIDI